MTKTLDLPAETNSIAAPRKDRSSVVYSIWALFTMNLFRQALSRRTLVLAALYLLPIVFALLIRQTEVGFAGPTLGSDPKLAEFLLIFNMFPQSLIPLVALVYASGMIQDELEEQTITYLLIRPLPRWAIYVAKLASTLVVTIGLTAVFTAITYLVIGWGKPDYWSDGATSRMFKTIALFSLALATYDALFGLLSLLMKRSLLLGIGYIIFLEGLVANIDFVVRKGTVMYYFRVLCEKWMDLTEVWHSREKLNYAIDFNSAPGILTCLEILVGAITILVATAGYLMTIREFRVKTPEGN